MISGEKRCVHDGTWKNCEVRWTQSFTTACAEFVWRRRVILWKISSGTSRKSISDLTTKTPPKIWGEFIETASHESRGQQRGTVITISKTRQEYPFACAADTLWRHILVAFGTTCFPWSFF